VIRRVDVEALGVIALEPECGAGREQPGRHGVIPVIVFEHAEAAYRQPLLEVVEPLLDRGDMGVMPDLHQRIGLVAPHDETSIYISRSINPSPHSSSTARNLGSDTLDAVIMDYFEEAERSAIRGTTTHCIKETRTTPTPTGRPALNGVKPRSVC